MPSLTPSYLSAIDGAKEQFAKLKTDKLVIPVHVDVSEPVDYISVIKHAESLGYEAELRFAAKSQSLTITLKP